MNTSYINQEFNEKRYSRRQIDKVIRNWFSKTPEIQEKIIEGVQYVEDYMAGDYYESKAKRVSGLDGLNLTDLVTDIYVGICYFIREELFTSVSAQLASRIGFNDKASSIATMAEILAVLCATDVFDIHKSDRSESLVLQSNFDLPMSLKLRIDESEYLPPMVCKPKPLVNNFSSGHLTFNETLLLGTSNHHDGDICLDTLNKMNNVKLKLNTEFLCSVEEMPKFELDTPDKIEQWKVFKIQSYRFYKLMVDQGNEFYLTHRVDSRGRAYASGYHISTQGTAFKKAMLEFAEEELIEGIPDWAKA